jgi:hypothetical protein
MIITAFKIPRVMTRPFMLWAHRGVADFAGENQPCPCLEYSAVGRGGRREQSIDRRHDRCAARSKEPSSLIGSSGGEPWLIGPRGGELIDEYEDVERVPMRIEGPVLLGFFELLHLLPGNFL